MPRMNYRGIADDLTRRINAGEWKPGERIPTTDAVASEYDVSETTAYRALSLMADRGVVYGEPGRGRFVAEQPSG